MRVAIKEPKKPIVFKEIEGTLESFQKAVGGYIDIINVEENLLVIFNDEGRLLGLEPNFYFETTLLVGTVIFCNTDGEKFFSLSSGNERFLQNLEREGYFIG